MTAGTKARSRAGSIAGADAQTYREVRPQLALAVAGALLVGAAYLLLPEDFTIGPNWLLLAIESVVLLPLLIAAYVRPLPRHVARPLHLAVQLLLTLALLASVVHLATLATLSSRGVVLLRPAAVLWVSNILIFALWYWELDGEGPIRRHQRGHPAVDFLFPQQANGKRWAPGFVDYLFVAFCFATALSPADTAPLTARAKLLLMAQAIISMTILLLLIARAVNIL
jgi:hypothetical protein